MKRNVLKNLLKFSGKYLCQVLFFKRKKRLWLRCFPVNSEKFLTTSFYTEHLWWLFLDTILIKKRRGGRFGAMVPISNATAVGQHKLQHKYLDELLLNCFVMRLTYENYTHKCMKHLFKHL